MRELGAIEKQKGDDKEERKERATKDKTVNKEEMLEDNG